MKKFIIFFVLGVLTIPILALAEEKVCDIRFRNGKWEKFVILKFTSDGVEAIPYQWGMDLNQRSSGLLPMQYREFIDKYDIDYVLCDTAIRFPEDELAIRVIKYTEVRRDPTLAGILSLVFVGGGQIYNREDSKASVFIISQLVMAFIVFNNEPKGLNPLDNPGIAVALLSIIPVVSMRDAVISADRINKDLKKKYNISLILNRKTDMFYCRLNFNF